MKSFVQHLRPLCALLGATLLAASCAGRSVVPPAPAAEARPVPAVAPTFPPIPRVVGPVDVRVVYPPSGALVAARDSTFIFGSVGTGGATLAINGTPVPVLPNGSWLAWLPLPPRDRPAYEIVAAQGSDTVRAIHRITYPAAPRVLPETGALVVDTASLAPRPPFSRMGDELVRLSVRAPRNATVRFHWGRDSVRTFPSSLAAGFANHAPASALEVPAHLLARGDGRVVVTRGADTVSLGAPRIALADSAWGRYAVVGSATPGGIYDSSRTIVARPVPGGTYKWFLFDGTLVELTGRTGDAARVRLAPGLDVWVDAAEVRPVEPGLVPLARIAGNARVVSFPAYSELRIPLAIPPAWSVDEGERALDLTLYSTTANSDIINLPTGDSVIRRVTWEQVAEGRARYRVELHEPSYGYVVRWERNALVLRVRRAPRIDPERPLAGLTIAVDAGHPPGGSTGPTGLYEAVATLAISNRLKPLLEGRGATVVMTRTGPSALALGARQPAASNAGAHAFVSIHLNALPDGVNPFTAHGTGTYYFNPSSEPLARQVQRGMLRTMGLRDLGVYYDNLAVLRPSWMPSILCEGAFLMMPEQEALLRMPEFQQAYAEGVAEGVEAYFRGLGVGQRR